MGQVLLKPGVDMGTCLTPAGARILEIVKDLAEEFHFDITITSGRDGEHSGPNDPHYTGEAFDLRSHGLNPGQKQALVDALRSRLYREPRRFYVVLESPGEPGEHIHVQRRNGSAYSMLDYLQSL